MQYLKRFNEEFKPEIKSLSDIILMKTYPGGYKTLTPIFCGNCGHGVEIDRMSKNPTKDLYGQECDNCGMVFGKKVDLVKGDGKLPNGYYLSSQKYDYKVEDEMPTDTTSGPGKCPPGQEWNPITKRCEKGPSSGDIDKTKKLFKFAYASDSNCPPGHFWSASKGKCVPDPEPPTQQSVINTFSNMLERYMRVLVLAYTNSLSPKHTTKASQIPNMLKNLQRVANGRNVLTIKDSINTFFQFIDLYSEKSSDGALRWLSTSDGRKYADDVIKFEFYCEKLLKL